MGRAGRLCLYYIVTGDWGVVLGSEHRRLLMGRVSVGVFACACMGDGSLVLVVEGGCILGAVLEFETVEVVAEWLGLAEC